VLLVSVSSQTVDRDPLRNWPASVGLCLLWWFLLPVQTYQDIYLPRALSFTFHRPREPPSVGVRYCGCRFVDSN
jgi:hypothetical protein